MSAVPQLLLDNRVNVSSDFSILMKYSANQISQQRVKADGSSWQSQILFNNIVVPNMATTLVNRNLRISYDVVLSYDVANAGASSFAYVLNNKDGLVENDRCDTVLRAFPLQSITDTVQLTINGITISQQTRDILDAVLHTVPKEYLENQASECPSMLDNAVVQYGDVENWGGWTAGANWDPNTAGKQSVPISRYGENYTFTVNVVGSVPTVGQVYPLSIVSASAAENVADLSAMLVMTANWANNTVVGNIFVKRNQSNQPLSTYRNSNGATRGSFAPVSVSLAGTTQTIRYHVVEDLLMSPLTLHQNETALANVNTMSLLMTYSKLSTDMFYSTNAMPAEATIEIQNPELLIQYMSVDPGIVKIPPSVSYSYELPNVLKNQQALTYTTTKFEAQAVQTQNYRLNAMPSKIFLCSRAPLTSRTSPQTATFNSLGQNISGSAVAGISLSLGTREGLLSSATNQDLYRMAVRNGYQYSYNRWIQNTVYIIDPVSDLGLNPQTESYPLENQGSVNLSIQFYENNYGRLLSGVAPTGTTAEVVLIPLYKGTISITPQQMFNSIAVLSSNEVEQILKTQPKDGSMMSDEAVKPSIAGAGLFDTLKSIAGHTASALASPLAQNILSKANDYLNK